MNCNDRLQAGAEVDQAAEPALQIENEPALEAKTELADVGQSQSVEETTPAAGEQHPLDASVTIEPALPAAPQEKAASEIRESPARAGREGARPAATTQATWDDDKDADPADDYDHVRRLLYQLIQGQG